MKLFINILSLLFIVCPGITLGQTYFNMRYPPDPGTRGSGSYSVVVDDTSYFFSRWEIDQSMGRWRNTISMVTSSGVFCCNTDSLQYVDKNLFIRGFNRSADGFVQATTIRSYNPDVGQYGVLKYDSNGNRVSTFIDTNTYLYISRH